MIVLEKRKLKSKLSFNLNELEKNKSKLNPQHLEDRKH